MTKIEVAIWHPRLSASAIEQAIGMPASIALSVGESRRPGSGIREETYCRFDLGKFPHVLDAPDLAIFEQFRDFISSCTCAFPSASWVAYFKLEEDESEIYLKLGALTYLTQMNFGVVMRS